MSLTIEHLEEWLGNGMYQVNLKFNDLSEIVNFCDKKGDIMVKSTESTSVFDTKTAKERSDYVKDNQDKVKEYKSGKDKLFGFFVGQAMKVSGGKANPQLVNEILKKKLK